MSITITKPEPASLPSADGLRSSRAHSESKPHSVGIRRRTSSKFRRRPRRTDSVVANGAGRSYLISYGDTMTALLAFFIVLNLLAEEQTGARLYRGIESFSKLAGTINEVNPDKQPFAERVIKRSYRNPFYLPLSSETKDRNQGTGPATVPDRRRMIEYQKEILRRYLLEVERFAKVDTAPDLLGATVLDFFHLPTKNAGPEPEMLGAFRAAVQRLPDERYSVEVVVWARNPGPNAWTDATRQANRLRAQLLGQVNMPVDLVPRITCSGRPWFFSNETRPACSLVVKKTNVSAAKPTRD